MDFVEHSIYLEDLKRIINVIPVRSGNFLVTGATGLIGSCIIDALVYAKKYLGRNYIIHAMSRTESKLQERFGYAGDDVKFIAQDVCKPIDPELQLDYIISAASNADPGAYALYPVETITTNVLGTFNMLEYARYHSKVRVLFTSTMEVYGYNISNVANREDDCGIIDFNSVRSGYPESKRTAELLCKSYADEYGIDTVIARLGYIYGPTMTVSDNKAVAQFIRKAARGEDIVLKSAGLQRRSYCYVADAVSGIFTVLFKGETGNAYNVADDSSVVTIRDLAEQAAAAVGKNVVFELPSEIEKKGSSKPCDAVLCTDKLSELGYQALIDTKSGLKRTIQIIKEKEENR